MRNKHATDFLALRSTLWCMSARSEKVGRGGRSLAKPFGRPNEYQCTGAWQVTEEVHHTWQQQV
jgi:hypothetical protein